MIFAGCFASKKSYERLVCALLSQRAVADLINWVLSAESVGECSGGE